VLARAKLNKAISNETVARTFSSHSRTGDRCGGYEEALFSAERTAGGQSTVILHVHEFLKRCAPRIVAVSYTVQRSA
jgi:hypothetical protein